MAGKPVYLKSGKYIYFPEQNIIINSEIKKQFLRYSKRKVVEEDKKEISELSLRNKIKKSLAHIIFFLTDDCNLRCKYCINSGIYSNINNTYRKKSLDFEIAKKGLLYIHDLLKERAKKSITIGFYGGEPLLEFNNIVRIVELSKSLFNGWNLDYGMTTNLTLLNRNMVKYFIANKFFIHASVDGPPENHDKKRIFTNAKGSFNRVMDSLKLIKEIDESYYYNNVGIISIFSKDLSLLSSYKYFTTNQLVKRNFSILDFVLEYNTCYYDKYPINKYKLMREIGTINKKLISKSIHNKVLSRFENAFMVSHKSLADSLTIKRYPDIASACLFDVRMLIDVYGKFHICEKINDKLPIGDVWEGFNYKEMARIVNDFVKLLKDNCKDCDVKYLCTRCYLNFAACNDKFEFDEAFCNDNKRGIRYALEEFIELKEKGITFQ